MEISDHASVGIRVGIRVAHPDDLEAIARLHLLVWRATYASMAPKAAFDALDAAARQQHWFQLLERDPDRWTTLVAERGVDDTSSELLGFCHAGPASHPVMQGAGEIVHLYVDPSAHGAGIGSTLLTRGVEFLRGNGFKTVRLAVVRGNDAAIGFYERHAFRVVDSFVDGVLWRSDNLVLERTV